jgi:Ca-activated chloride channel family protein
MSFVWMIAPLERPVSAQQQRQVTPTFKSSIELVSVAAVVRDRRGRVVRDLSREDFQVFDGGESRPIIEFADAEADAISIALVVDVSGSMAAAANLAAARRVVDHVLAWMKPGSDEIALFSFDRVLREEEPFTTDLGRMSATIGRLEAWGMTSMWDALGGTAQRLRARPSKRRAIILLTDGNDNASRLSSEEVASGALAADMPVYVVAVVPWVDRIAREGRPNPVAVDGPLGNLTYWSGGSIFTVSNDSEASVAARTLLEDLRHQYVFAIEPAAAASGWRPLDIRLQRKGLTVRARAGYYAGVAPRDGQ